ncbi:PTS sugar transporter subunit IIA [Lactobacillus sp. PV034]|uniref:PTS sugar transporter subunit IIA n=1 Tax=Lactobacillus sp. PV034 TaxID=2594495 RepID=UPI00223FFD4B|nr:PTS sugar transporter subunit IIA [Lactobacillus sp. PV034]QNQ81031.1 PTS sugar transporter subunit IIA [Lactobacillus sp. PV034]
MTDTISLFEPKMVFVTDETDRNKIFKAVYDKLYKQGYVKEDFINNIIEREEKYPTGVSTRPLSKDLPNIAIPHTEGQYVNKRLIIPVGLKTPIKFNNMVNPAEELEVKFLFILLNKDPKMHSNMLAKIMDFLAQTPVADLNELFASDDPNYIYDFLDNNF